MTRALSTRVTRPGAGRRSAGVNPSTDEHATDAAGPAAGTVGTPVPRLSALQCRLCGARYAAAPIAICERCLGPLEPLPDEGDLRRRDGVTRQVITSRPPSLWRYAEWLPFDGRPRLSPDTGFTPLVDAPALARLLGVERAWVKNDTVSHPSLSFKDRVVATGINAAHALGLTTVGCASTGNLANAVAAHAARAGLAAWVFIPHDLELGKVVGAAIYRPHLVRVQGTYDDVNRLCAQVADEFGWGILNVNLRAYYGEGSKTMAFEIAEQLDWRSPTAVVAPLAGGSLLSKLAKGFGEFRSAGLIDGPPPRFYGAQAAGCAPIVRLVERGDDRIVPEIPSTIARSIAIGNPADGLFAARTIRESGGWGAAVSDVDLVRGIRILAECTGIFAETAGGATVAAALALARAGHWRASDEVVLCITGHGLKTVEAVAGTFDDAPVIAPRLRDVAALAARVAQRTGG
ncbi:MAG TPA: threonine synthase [Gemmatimonadaceae bacterium]|nr:threonine synthase [Gemmatimonadaceae bacterium]